MEDEWMELLPRRTLYRPGVSPCTRTSQLSQVTTTCNAGTLAFYAAVAAAQAMSA